MKKSFLIALAGILLSTVALESCKPSKNGRTKGRQQPKNGKMPCPMKDC